jgi:hypothetical protein
MMGLAVGRSIVTTFGTAGISRSIAGTTLDATVGIRRYVVDERGRRARARITPRAQARRSRPAIRS